MIVAINDISFIKGFSSSHDARRALKQFGYVCLGLKDERIRNVNAPVDIINSPSINKALEIAPGYKLIQALNDIKTENREQFLFILQVLTNCGTVTSDNDTEFCVLGYSSTHCARYKDDILISIVSDDLFGNDMIAGVLNNGTECKIRNISNDCHKYLYWEALGFREYEVNSKHGQREYIRAGGLKVGIAPDTDETGQKLLNKAVEYKNRLYSVDYGNGNRIFEFRHSYGNKFHAFLRDDLPEPDVRNICLLQDDERCVGIVLR